MPERDIERAIEGIADGASVEWDALERVLNDEELGLLRHLRVIGGIADLHRSTTTDDGEPSLSRTTKMVPERGAAIPEAPRRAWGRYQLREKVGEGSYGSVYRAWDPDLEREIAIKILHKRVADHRLKEALLREGRALARIRDPHVVNVIGVESHEDQVALCMEFVRGETLEEVLRSKGTLNAREAMLVGEDVCRALAAVHLAGFIHRDVKARNVMREQAGRIVLMDFGAGQEADELKLGGRVNMIGTPSYMAPELLAGQRANACSDVYSTGVLLYHLVTSEYPVEGRTADDLRAAHMQGRRRLLSDRRPELPLSFIQVVERAIAADPERRYATAGALLEALAEAAGAQKKARSLVIAASAVIGAFLIITFFGFLTTSWFNMATGRTAPFNDEPPTVWLEMGARSLFTPILYILTALLVSWAARFSLRVLSLSQRIRDLLNAVKVRATRLTTSLNLDDPTVFGQAVATFGIIALAATIWRFSDVLRAMTATINDAAADTLLPLRFDEHRVGPSLYRAVLDVLMLAFGAALFRIGRLRARLPPSGRGSLATVAPIAAMLIITALLLEVPFRLTWRNAAPKIDVAGERCYILGERSREALAFCPDRTPPRNQIIKLDDPAVRRLGTIESIFTPPVATR